MTSVQKWLLAYFPDSTGQVYAASPEASSPASLPEVWFSFSHGFPSIPFLSTRLGH